MPMVLDWGRFRDLTDAPGRVFESLCRAIVQRNYGMCGSIRSRRNQPGVEFFMRIDRPCDLGDANRVFGWSCKWFELLANHRLSSSQRAQITDSIEKAIEHVNGLTDFVLCLPELPTQSDIEWYFDHPSLGQVKPQLWANEELEARMTGGAEVLRRTYFGELVITSEGLAEAHERSVAPLQKRWMRELHVDTHVDSAISQALFRAGSMDDLRDHADTIAGLVLRLEDHLDEAHGEIHDQLGTLVEGMNAFAGYLSAIVDAANGRRPVDALDLTTERQTPDVSEQALRELARNCRRSRSQTALIVDSFIAEIQHALDFVDDMNLVIKTPMTAVVGDAGLGKTQIAAQLTAPGDDRIAGVFIQGGDLRTGATLDDLASRVPGVDVSRFEDLLEMIESAGARAGCRIPLIIDGLNEAERPAEWRQLLEQVVPILSRYSHVLLIVTARSAIRRSALPETALVFELEWQGQSVDEIVERYFEHYRIDPGEALLPRGLFRIPLFVRMYCEAANPERQETVGAEVLPNSLVGVFELYRRRVADRLTNDPARLTLPPGHVEKQLARFAQELWHKNARRLPYNDAKALIDEPGVSWDESLYRRLEDEGVLNRYEHSGYQDSESGVLFDGLAGYLISDHLLGGLSLNSVKKALGANELWEKLVGPDPHPLGQDILGTLVGLLPRRFHMLHLWTIAPEQHRLRALLPTLELESELLDNDTIDQLGKHIASRLPPRHGRHPFDRLWEVHNVARHQLNAEFLDRILRSVPLPIRDRTWTEWIRQRSQTILLEHLHWLISQWESSDTRDEQDDLSAIAVVWMLSSTESAVRDLATKALQRYGRPAPERLFGVAERMVEVDDPYVEERIVVAALGTMTLYQSPDPGGVFTRALAAWLGVLNHRYLDGGRSPTSNELIRTYVRASFEFAQRLHPAAMPDGIAAEDLRFAPPPPFEPMDDDDERADECNRTLQLDFKNYTIGSVIQGRGNYNFNHAEYRNAVAQVRGRVWELGWRASLLGQVDEEIAKDQWQRQGRLGRVERYGKKYGWIAYHELVGRLDDIQRLRKSWISGDRHVIGDVDPTFPKEPDPVPVQLPDWAKEQPVDDEIWVRSGEIAVPPDLWVPDSIDGQEGPWILAEGFLEHQRHGRQVFGFFRTHLVDDSAYDNVVRLISDKPYLGNDFLPGSPSHDGIFAGEMPWSARFEVDSDDSDLAPGHGLLRKDWYDAGTEVEMVATEYTFGSGRTATSLDRSYFVPSYGFARAFDLRQLPGTLNLVTLDGAYASLTFKAASPWQGDLLYLRKDLLLRYADKRRVVQVAWGERLVTGQPSWWGDVYDNMEHLWRELKVLE